MELAIHIPDLTLAGGPEALPRHLTEIARAAEAAGCRTVTLMDHWLQIADFGAVDEPMLEGYTTLGFLAGRTERVTLGLLVTGVTYRYPALLAKIVATLDVLSGGRAQLGIGAAWFEREHRALGVPYPPVGERLDRLEEAVEIVRQMWSDDDGPYRGRHNDLAETICAPAPLRRPHPPIMIAGGGERRLLRLVARLGDACNLMQLGDDTAQVEHKLRVLDRHCAELGREPSQVRRTVITDLDPGANPDRFLGTMGRLAAVGVDEVYAMTADADDPAGWVARVAGAMVPRLAELGPR
jgi:F420-dependent oxidoreductase-like protein